MSDWWNIAKAWMFGNFTLVDASFDASVDTLQCALIDNEGGSPYTFDASHDYVSNVFDGGTTGLEFSGSGYSRQSLTTKAINADDGNNRGEFDADDVTFGSVDGATAAAALIHEVGPTDDTDSPLLWHLTSTDFPITANGGDIVVSFQAEGIAHIT